MAAKGSDDIAARELKPNVFLALQVQSPVIHQRLIETAGKILDYDEKLAEALEAVEKSHITLLGLFFVCKQTGKVCKVADPVLARIQDLVPGGGELAVFPHKIKKLHCIGS